MKCSLGVSNFLEEISSLSHSIVFLYFFTLISEERRKERCKGEKKYIYPSECRVPKNNKETRKPSSVINVKK